MHGDRIGLPSGTDVHHCTSGPLASPSIVPSQSLSMPSQTSGTHSTRLQWASMQAKPAPHSGSNSQTRPVMSTGTHLPKRQSAPVPHGADAPHRQEPCTQRSVSSTPQTVPHDPQIHRSSMRPASSHGCHRATGPASFAVPSSHGWRGIRSLRDRVLQPPTPATTTITTIALAGITTCSLLRKGLGGPQHEKTACVKRSASRRSLFYSGPAAGSSTLKVVPFSFTDLTSTLPPIFSSSFLVM